MYRSLTVETINPPNAFKCCQSTDFIRGNNVYCVLCTMTTIDEMSIEMIGKFPLHICIEDLPMETCQHCDHTTYITKPIKCLVLCYNLCCGGIFKIAFKSELLSNFYFHYYLLYYKTQKYIFWARENL